MSDSPQSVFLDTSIQIARVAHGPDIVKSIESRLDQYSRRESGLVVRQEFKRRLLKEAYYLLKQLHARNSYERVRRHVQDTLPPAWNRKKQISLQLITTIDEQDGDEDRTERARLLLRSLIKTGIKTFEAELHSVNLASGCACGSQPIIEKTPFIQYDFGSEKCSTIKGKCGIREFLESNAVILRKIADYLQTVPVGSNPGDKTGELQATEDFIGKFLAAPDDVRSGDPCSKLGDLLIALESQGCGTMYTLNMKESQHLARVLGQSLIYRPPNPDKPEVECSSGAETWPKE